MKIKVKVGDKLSGGDVYAECQETSIITHRCMLPPNVAGEVISVKKMGSFQSMMLL